MMKQNGKDISEIKNSYWNISYPNLQVEEKDLGFRRFPIGVH